MPQGSQTIEERVLQRICMHQKRPSAIEGIGMGCHASSSDHANLRAKSAWHDLNMLVCAEVLAGVRSQGMTPWTAAQLWTPLRTAFWLKCPASVKRRPLQWACATRPCHRSRVCATCLCTPRVPYRRAGSCHHFRYAQLSLKSSGDVALTYVDIHCLWMKHLQECLQPRGSKRF